MTDLVLKEPTTIGLSDQAHAMLKRLAEDKQNGNFGEMADAYRFGIALALAHGVIPEEIAGQRTTIFNVGTLDPDKQIYTTIRSLWKTGDTPVYRWAERLAEWGVREMTAMSDKGELDIGTILAKAQEVEQAQA
jgi:hypothetical protein